MMDLSTKRKQARLRVHGWCGGVDIKRVRHDPSLRLDGLSHSYQYAGAF